MILKSWYEKNLLLLSIASFVLVASTALVLSKPDTLPEVLSFEKTTKEFSPIPVIADNVSFPTVSAQSVLVVDLESGVTLYEKNADKLLLPASTTKIITALTAMQYYSEEKTIVVGSETKVEGQKMGLVVGEKILVRDLLQGLLIYSANDAAEVLAANFPGGRDGFITSMNMYVSKLNLENTHFTNPSGLDSPEHVSTARDLVRVSQVAMKNPRFAEIVGTKETVVESVDGAFRHKLVNINELVGKVEGVLGVKTGWTQEARENLVTYVDRKGVKVMLALLGGQDRFAETEELIAWVFDNYQWEKVVLP